jgi:hypothetical protein
MGWFSENNERFRVSGTVEGWFGRRTVRKTVTGRVAANREAERLRRRGATRVRIGRDGWWAW